MTVKYVSGCVCGHDHRTARGESIDLCLECQCTEFVAACANCGAEAWYGGLLHKGLPACSGRCVAQLEHADTLASTASGPGEPDA